MSAARGYARLGAASTYTAAAIATLVAVWQNEQDREEVTPQWEATPSSASPPPSPSATSAPSSP